jgi:hypothetical protein
MTVKELMGEVEELVGDGTGPHGKGKGPGKGRGDGSGLPLSDKEVDSESEEEKNPMRKSLVKKEAGYIENRYGKLDPDDKNPGMFLPLGTTIGGIVGGLGGIPLDHPGPMYGGAAAGALVDVLRAGARIKTRQDQLRESKLDHIPEKYPRQKGESDGKYNRRVNREADRISPALSAGSALGHTLLAGIVPGITSSLYEGTDKRKRIIINLSRKKDRTKAEDRALQILLTADPKSRRILSGGNEG